MLLKVGNKGISAPLETILKQVRLETGNKFFKHIQVKGDNLAVTCPSHKDGQENRPSCYVYIGDDTITSYGQTHCFSCGFSLSFVDTVAFCFNESQSFAEEWLIERFGDVFLETNELLPEIELNSTKKLIPCVDSSVLSEYDYYHDYMWKRKLTRDVVDKFRVGYDKRRNAITFPMWDEHSNFVGVTARSVATKRFWIPENIEKPVYLLNVSLFENDSCIYICESQLNALTLRTFGFPGVALIGTGTPHQYEVLNKCGIVSFVTCFDGDAAGEQGRSKFHKNIKNAIITDIIMPAGKDVNDLTQDEFLALKEIAFA